jgi:hypothetical protein
MQAQLINNPNIGSYVSSNKQTGDFSLSSRGKVAPLLIGSDDYPGVIKIAGIVQEDIFKVSGTKPVICKDNLPTDKEIIIIGTLGKSKLLDQLIIDKKIDVSDIKGKWEVSLIQVIEKPFPGVEKALVIIGSDKRGTIYGMFDLSRKIGVSPWYFWADVPIKKQSELFVKKGRYNLGEPKVKYRGIFLNDEEPCLGQWAIKNYGGFNHQFYEKVFELILRLKGNYLWPAMWWASFNSNDSINPKLADEMGIVMSTSHHEPMMRAHAEWTPFREKGDKWDYAKNPEGLKKFWREGIERMGNYESVVTLAMRGDGDEAMENESNISLLEEIVKEQRKILCEVTGKPVEQIPQVWALYKEVQEYYDKGMRVPDDVTLLLCDDNWGNVRKLPELNDLPRKGGYGMYYHFDFVGGPRNYKWVNTSQLPRIWEQMHLTYSYGVDRIWIVNVGDLKPMELPISFFLDYAWNPELLPANKINEFTLLWAKEQFGEKNANEIAEILNLYTKYNGRRKPELLYSDTYSVLNYREFETIVADYNNLCKKAENLFNSIEQDKKDAFYQLVYHPVQACSNLNELYYTHALNIMYQKQGRETTNDMAQKLKDLFRKDSLITLYYHTQLANGKWDKMMAQTHIGYKTWQEPPRNSMPPSHEIIVPDEGIMGVCIEGTDKSWPNDTSLYELPYFDSFNQQSSFIEIFNKGKKSISYQIKPSHQWIKLSSVKGDLIKQERIIVEIDWQKLKPGKHKGTLEIENEKGQSFKTTMVAIKYNDNEIKQAKGFLENRGVVSIEAENFSKSIENSEIRWLTIPSLGRTLSGVTSMPVTKNVEKITSAGPCLEYEFYLLEKPKDGKVKVNIYLSPSLNFKNGKGLHYAVSINNEFPQLNNMHQGTEVSDWKYPEWWNNAVSNSIIIKKSEHLLSVSGKHVLKFWCVDPAVVVQKIVIDNGGLKPSYLGPPQSLRIK